MRGVTRSGEDEIQGLAAGDAHRLGVGPQPVKVSMGMYPGPMTWAVRDSPCPYGHNVTCHKLVGQRVTVRFVVTRSGTICDTT